MLRVRLNCIDHYMARPDKQLDSCVNSFAQSLQHEFFHHVPVLRIFGSTETGQKVTLHVHQIFPYFYIQPPTHINGMQDFAQTLGVSLNHALALSYGVKTDDWRASYVAAIVPVLGIPYYGFHAGYQVFLKIHLLDPKTVSRAAELLETGAVMGQRWPVFEAHIPYHLQFKIDYNLYGMDFIHLSRAQFRLPAVPRIGHPDDWCNNKVLALGNAVSHLSRTSHTHLEVDTQAWNIVNSSWLPERLDQPLVDLATSKEKKGKLVSSLRAVWEDEAARRARFNIDEPLEKKSQEFNRKRKKFRNEDQLLSQLQDQLDRVLSRLQQVNNTTDTTTFPEFPKTPQFPTAFASRTALYPPSFNTCSSPEPSPVEPSQASSATGSQSSQFKLSQVCVDEDRVREWKSEYRAKTQLQRQQQEDNSQRTLQTLLSNLSQQNADIEEQADMSIDQQSDEETEAILQWMADHASSQPTVNTQQQSLTKETATTISGNPLQSDDIIDDMIDRSVTIEQDFNSSDLLFSDDDLVSQQHWPVDLETFSDPEFDENEAIVHDDFGLENDGAIVFENDEDHGMEHKTVLNTDELLVDLEDIIAPPSPPSPSNHSSSSSSTSRIMQVDGADDEERPRKKRKFIIPPKRYEPTPNASTSRASKDEIVDDQETQNNMTVFNPNVHMNQAKSSFPTFAANSSFRTRITRFKPPSFHRRRPFNISLAAHMQNLDTTSPLDKEQLRFGETLSEVWSDDERDESWKSRPSFYYDPPQPTSPSALSGSRKSQRSESKNSVSNSFDSIPRAQSSFHNDGFDFSFELPEPGTLNMTHVPPSISSQDTATPRPITYVLPNVYRTLPPPTAKELTANIRDYGLPEVIYQDPFYSSKNDVPKRPVLFAGREFKLKGNSLEWLEEFDTSETRLDAYFDTLSQKYSGWHLGSQFKVMKGKEKENEDADGGLTRALEHMNMSSDSPKVAVTKKVWVPAMSPPSPQAVRDFLKNEQDVKFTGKRKKRKWEVMVESARDNEQGVDRRDELDSADDVNAALARRGSQIEGPTPAVQSQSDSQVRAAEKQHDSKEWLDILSVEVHVCSRGKLLPNPKIDAINAIFFDLATDEEDGYSHHTGVILVDDGYSYGRSGLPQDKYNVFLVENERQLLNALVERVRKWDPDILAGYEIHRSSWGYIIERASLVYEMNILEELSRVQLERSKNNGDDSWSRTNMTNIAVTGRHILNIWRLMRTEIAVTSYSLENCVYHVLRHRTPHYSDAVLTEWWRADRGRQRWKTISYYFQRVKYNIDLLDRTNLMKRTCEFARVFGVDFYSVITRGSQFKVESLMCRLAKPENFIMHTPSKHAVAGMRAPEALPLVMEPQSRFYKSPLLVLDFQSLYPSIMIAYNYCYSTCLGRIVNAGEERSFGTSTLQVPAHLIDRLRDHINVSPNGVVFVKQHVREGVLGRMLSELLDTRVMVKSSMKQHKDRRSIVRTLDARQLGLKYISNVTYGYTAASFSGRMPCAEIADSIVQTGREILEQAIELINTTEKWGAEVVYGDTDSLFVYLPGCAHDRAFSIAKEIVQEVTSRSPAPITLKFEKVYHPCVLLSKKRYVGFKYESVDEKVPTFDAKGIETVRRDGCPVVAKMMESCLKILFRSQDLSQVKSYCYRQWTKIMSGRVSLIDFIIAKEVKLGTYSDRGQLPPGAQVALRKMAQDTRAEPQYGERVPYVVVHNGPNTGLAESSVAPEVLVYDRNLRLHAEYYITKQIIPPLARVFNLVGADIMSWYLDMPRLSRAIRFSNSQLQMTTKRNVTIERFYKTHHCLMCHATIDPKNGKQRAFCDGCLSNPQKSILALEASTKEAEQKYCELVKVCGNCSLLQPRYHGETPCENLDCLVFYTRVKARTEVKIMQERLSALSLEFDVKQ